MKSSSNLLGRDSEQYESTWEICVSKLKWIYWPGSIFDTITFFRGVFKSVLIFLGKVWKQQCLLRKDKMLLPCTWVKLFCMKQDTNCSWNDSATETSLRLRDDERVSLLEEILRISFSALVTCIL